MCIYHHSYTLDLHSFYTPYAGQCVLYCPLHIFIKKRIVHHIYNLTNKEFLWRAVV